MSIKILSPKLFTVQLSAEFDGKDATPASVTVQEFANVDNAIEMPTDVPFLNINDANADGDLTGSHNPDIGGPVILRLAPASKTGFVFEAWEKQQRAASLININGTIAAVAVDLVYDLVCGGLQMGPRGMVMGNTETAPRAWTFRFTKVEAKGTELSKLYSG